MAKTAQFSQGLRSAQGDLRRFGGGTKAVLGGLGRAVLPVGLVAGFADAVQGVEMFNRAMLRSLSIMDNVSSSMRADLEATARSVASETIHSSTELAGAYYELASAGLDAKRAQSALPTVARFAQAANFDLAQSVHLLTTSVSALGLASNDAATYEQNLARVSDVLARSANVSEATISGLAEALTNKAAASARLLGQDVEEVVAVLSVFAKQGKEGEAAGEAYAIVMRDLQNAAIENAQAFEAMGVAVFDTAGNMLPISGIIQQLEQAMSGLSDEQKRMSIKDLGFQDRSVHQIQSLLGFSEEIKRLQEDFQKNAAGESAKVADAMTTPYQKSAAKLKASWEEVANVIGGPVITALSKVMDATTFIVRELIDGGKALKSLATDAANAITNRGTAKPGLGAGSLGLAGAMKKGVEAGALAKPIAPIAMPEPAMFSQPSGVGAVEVGTSEAFNSLQKALHQQSNQQLQIEKEENKKLDEQVSILKRIERNLGRPQTELEFV